MLRENPDRYINPAVRHGADRKLPPEIAAGLDTTKPDLIERRQPWNKPAPADYALPTEIWREVVPRRQRGEETRRKLAAGEVREVNDFITLNLDRRQFAQDVIQNCEGPDLLMALWQAITTITLETAVETTKDTKDTKREGVAPSCCFTWIVRILGSAKTRVQPLFSWVSCISWFISTAAFRITVHDPTGGSGAFIFVALNILEPLYEACLDRMEAFLAEWGEHGKKAHPNYHKKLTEILARVDAHPNRHYFVLNSINVPIA